MALGDNSYKGGNSTGNKKYSPQEVRCPIRFRNPKGELEKSELAFSYWNGLMKVSINLKMENEENRYDSKNGANIYLTPIKAKILHDEIKEMVFGANKGVVRSVGAQSGTTGLIHFTDGKDFGVDHYLLVITSVSEDGTVGSNYIYQFNTYDYYKSIRNFNQNGGGTPTFDTSEFQMIEIETFMNILQQFYLSANGAIAASVSDALGFNNYRVNENINAIMDKLEISRSTGAKSKSNGSSFFNSSNKSESGSGFHKSTMNDLDGELE